MLVHGGDCSIVIKTAYREAGAPYAEETIREAVSLLTEEAALEGDGVCRAIRKGGGVTGCVVTPLTMGTVPLLLSVALGGTGLPLRVSETLNLYRYTLNLLPVEDGSRFDLVQDRGGLWKLYEGCAVTAFELRVHREDAIKLKLDIRGERPPAVYPSTGILKTEPGERFMGDAVSCRINGNEYRNMYGLTLSVKKAGGTRTELRIKRPLEHGGDLPDLIEELTITAQLLRDTYEGRYYGMFRMTLKGLVLVSDETSIDCADAVIGPLRYYVGGTVFSEVFTSDGENIA
jgi:hypothetical protein